MPAIMSSKTTISISICLLVVYFYSRARVYCAPIDVNDEMALYWTEPTILGDRENYLHSDEELEEFLRRTKEEAERSIRADRRNYAEESMTAEEIMAMFEERANMVEDSDEHICPICKDDLDSERVFETPCKHLFHERCISSYRTNVSNLTITNY